MYVWPTVCYVDPQWKKRIGWGWKGFLDEIIKESSLALGDAANCTLAPLDIMEWSIPRFEESMLHDQWLAQKEELQEYYSKCYGYTFDDRDLRGIFLLSLARVHLIRFSRTTSYAKQTKLPFLHLGFVGSLYWFHLSTKPNLVGGGMSSIAIPYAVVNFKKSKRQSVHTIVHEILHLFGAHHNKDGVMHPHSHEASLLDGDNKMFVEKSMKDFFENNLPLPGIERLFEQPPILLK